MQALPHRHLPCQSADLFLKFKEVKYSISSWAQVHFLMIFVKFIKIAMHSTSQYPHIVVWFHHENTLPRFGILYYWQEFRLSSSWNDWEHRYYIQPYIPWMSTCTQFFWARIQEWISWPWGCTKWLCRFTIHSSLRGFPSLCILASYTWCHRGATASHYGYT